MRNRVLILGAAAFIGIVAACSDSSGPGGASRVALLVNNNFVEYDTSIIDAEASEIEFTLADLGVTITQVTDVDSTSLAADLANSQAFVIPEGEGNFALNDSLTPGALTVIRDFVEGGGILVVIGDDVGQALLDSLWGYTLDYGNSQNNYAIDAAEAGGTAFSGGPAVVWDNDGTYITADSTYPAAARLVYRTGPDVAVAVIPQGSGAVVVLGWDWYDAAPHGAQDGGWIEVLKRALRS